MGLLAFKKPEKVKATGTLRQLADLVSIIRFEMGEAKGLQPFADKVNYNFQQWTFRRNAGAVHFTRNRWSGSSRVKDHIATSLSVQPRIDLSPFDRKGGLGRFYEVFGEEYEAILMEESGVGGKERVHRCQQKIPCRNRNEHLRKCGHIYQWTSIQAK
ncbi:MAG: type I restriction-modification enzyme R subunit C-terminal domain-containing protein [Hydrogeniiclostridium mannosilyticum]